MDIHLIIETIAQQGYLTEPLSSYSISENRPEFNLYESTEVNGKIKINANHGKNNHVLCGRNSQIAENSKIDFSGNNNLVIIGAYSSFLGADIRVIGDNNIFYFGAFSTVGSIIVMLTGQEGKISIGDFCMLSSRIIIDRSDHHSIYDLSTGEKINQDQDVNISNHVWIGRDVRINKGSRINKNSIIGQGAIVAGELSENTLFAGVPARAIRSNVTWSRMKSNNLQEMESSQRHQDFLVKVEKFKNYLRTTRNSNEIINIGHY